jgi:hypothetical protein
VTNAKGKKLQRLRACINDIGIYRNRGFLTIALEGQGKACDKVREYLLSMEQKARIDSIVYEKTGLDASDLSEIGAYMAVLTLHTMS